MNRQQTAEETLVFFVGPFSSGKSSLINALLGKKLLSVDVTPETAVPVELRYGKSAQAFLCMPDGARRPMAMDLLASANVREHVSAGGWIEANTPLLKDWPNLALVDLPGWFSGDRADEQAVINYFAHRSRSHLDTQWVYALVLSCEEGGLRDETRQKLQTLELGNASYLFLLSKSDKRSEEALYEVQSHLLPQIESILGKAPLFVGAVSARKNSIEPLRAAFAELQKAYPPQIDRAELAREIDYLLDRWDDVRVNQLVDEVFDDFWFDFDTLVDRNFDSLDYAFAPIMGKWFVEDLLSYYEKVLEKVLSREAPYPNDTVCEKIRLLGLDHPPRPTPSSDCQRKLTRPFKEITNRVIEKSKPGLFSSDDPDAVGSRIRSKLFDCKQEFRKAVAVAAHDELSKMRTLQIEGWRRLLALLKE